MDGHLIDGYLAAQVRAAEAPHLEAGEPLMHAAAAGLAGAIDAELSRGCRTGVADGVADLDVGGSRGDGRSEDGSRSVGGHGPSGPGRRPVRILVLAGSGNNGGDALFAGARLAASGDSVRILPVGSRLHAEGLAAARAAGATMIRALGKDGADSVDGAGDRDRVGDRDGAGEENGSVEGHADFGARVTAAVRESDVIVDGILGTGSGADPSLRGAARLAVAAIQEVLGQRFLRSEVIGQDASGARSRRQGSAGRADGVDARARVPDSDEPVAAALDGEEPVARVPDGHGVPEGRHPPLVVAVDIPSGINPDDGSVPDPTVLAANVTVTFGAHKAGLLIAPGSGYAGRIELIDIGLGPDLAQVEPVIRVPAPPTRT